MEDPISQDCDSQHGTQEGPLDIANSGQRKYYFLADCFVIFEPSMNEDL